MVDLFAGPGGWSEAARELGITEVGIEHDASACATRAAAGHLTIRQDVTTLDTARFCPLEGLIASPPCPTFSSAGGRAGIAELRYLIEHVHRCVTEWRPYISPMPDADPRSALVLEPLRFALQCCPQWIALEQVPDVMPVWEAYRFVLQAHGYSVWCGILNSADYGVPQTRRRAILIASQTRKVQPPEPTHCEGGASTMFGDLLPWVSMAEALGWGEFDAQYQRGAGLTERHGERPDRPCEAPAPTLTGSALGAGAGAGAKLKLVMRGNNTVAGGPLAERDLAEPAMTVGTRADLWTLHTNRGQDEHGNRQTRAITAPAPAFSSKSGAQWVFDRPATTVQGDPRLAPPGHRDREGGEPQFGADALRLTETDALRLQSFRADYPLQGTKTKRFEQVGNAVPPLLARHILSALSPPLPRRTAMNETERDAIAERAERATPGPWTFRAGYYGINAKGNVYIDRVANANNMADTVFIAHARSDIPALLDALRAAEERAEEAVGERDAAVELLREAAWMHGMIGPPHPDWTGPEHEEAEERWLRERVHPWLIVHGEHARDFDPDAPFNLLASLTTEDKEGRA